MSDVFHVTMLGVLREPFEQWLRGRGLVLAHVPGTEPDELIVIPSDELMQRFAPSSDIGAHPDHDRP